MRYRVRVAGKVFESENTKVLLKRAVEAKREALKRSVRPVDLVSLTQANISTPRSIQTAESP